MRARLGRRRRRGASLVEAVITTMVFVTLMLGMVDAGVGVSRQHILSEAARQGARLAIVHGDTPGKPSALAQWGPTTFTATGTSTDPKVTGIQPYLGGLDLSQVNIQIDWLDGNSKVESRVKVTVSTTWSPFMTSIFGTSPFALSASSTMPIAH